MAGRGLVLWLLLAAGCEVRQNMYNQPKMEPLEASRFFRDGRSARGTVEGTVARGYLREDEHLDRGKIDGAFAATFPFPVDAEVMARGRERYQIYCTPCHDAAGYGNGMIVKRGYKRPPSYHIDRLREVEPGYLFDVISNGFGVMAGYGYQLGPEDRWAVAAYMRALQLSQYARVDELAASDQARLEESEEE
jgi:mono/diheme cytochrome c family protein